MKNSLAPRLLVLAALLLTTRPASSETWTRPPEDRGEASPPPLPVEVAPDNANLHYEGRFERSSPNEAVCAWPASAVTVRFRGTAVNVRLVLGNNRCVAVVDGVAVKLLTAPAGPSNPTPKPAPLSYALASGLAEGEHRATIFKCTESFVGTATFDGFQLNSGATVLPAAPAKHKIKVIGDSISCGYGNESSDKNAPFSPTSENAWWAYGAIAARAVGADYECIAWSGRKLYPNGTLPEIYDRTLPVDAKSHWPGDRDKPDVILVNLCTNDFGRQPYPEHDSWVKAYCDFVARLRAESPRATIYCALGSMLYDGYPEGRPSQTMARGWIREVVKASNDSGDANVRFLEFAHQNGSDGLGAGYHPSIKTHQIMAEKFVEALRADLHW